LVEDEAQKDRSAEIRAICPVSVATYLLNEKRKTISSIEARNNTRVVIVPSAELMTPHFEVQRLRDDDEGTLETSYKIVSHTDESKDDEEDVTAKIATMPKPIVQLTAPSQPAPEPAKKIGLLARILKSISSLFSSDDDDKKKSAKRDHKRDSRRGAPNNRNRRDGRRRDRDRKDDREIRDNLEPRTPENKNPRDQSMSARTPCASTRNCRATQQSSDGAPERGGPTPKRFSRRSWRRVPYPWAATGPRERSTP
jgi:ribonuclease E